MRSIHSLFRALDDGLLISCTTKQGRHADSNYCSNHGKPNLLPHRLFLLLFIVRCCKTLVRQICASQQVSIEPRCILWFSCDRQSEHCAQVAQTTFQGGIRQFFTAFKASPTIYFSARFQALPTCRASASALLWNCRDHSIRRDVPYTKNEAHPVGLRRALDWSNA